MSKPKHTPEQRAALDEFTLEIEAAEIPELAQEELDAPKNRRFWDPLLRSIQDEESRPKGDL